MLMRTDPFRDLDRLSQAVFGTPARRVEIQHPDRGTTREVTAASD